MGCTGVTQELVDAFYMNDGYPVQETSFLKQSTLYTTEGTDTYKEKVVTSNNKKVSDAKNVSNRFMNREPRFYNTVFFQNRRWHVSNNVYPVP